MSTLSFAVCSSISTTVSAKADSTMQAEHFRVQTVVHSAPADVALAGGEDLATSKLPVQARDDDEWSNTKERRFSLLAAKVAAEVASSDEKLEMKRLQVLRRRTKNPPSADEVIFQFKRRQMEAKLLGDLRTYVEFLGSSGRSKA